MTKHRNKKLAIFILTLFLFFPTSFTYSQDNCYGYRMSSYEPGGSSLATPLFNIQILNKPCFEILNTDQNRVTISNLFDFIVSISIIMSIIMFTYGAARGTFYAVYAGEKAKGKETMLNAIIGLMMVLSIWLITNTINPDLLRSPFFGKIENLTEIKHTSSSNTGGAQLE